MKKILKFIVKPIRSLTTSTLMYVRESKTLDSVRNTALIADNLHICLSCDRNEKKQVLKEKNYNYTMLIDNSLDENEKNLLLNVKNENLSLGQRISYGFGHVFNDLCAAMWFSYLLFYLQIILEMESATAGVLLMIGQVSDALATPVAGWVVDKYASRKLWHIVGTLMVAVSFPLVFTKCTLCINETQQLLYHISVIVLFQIGWAIVQISHLSIIPNLTNIPGQRSELTAIRYTGAVCSSVIAYIVTWIVLRSNNLDRAIIGPADYYKFKEIVVVVLILGCISSIIFYGGIRWSKYNFKFTDITEKTIYRPIKEFYLSAKLYQISFLYVASRLYMTLNLVYMPLYLDERVSANATSILSEEISSENLRESLASVPLVSFIASFITALVLRNKTEHWGNKITYFIGSIISFSSCLCIGFYIAQSTNVIYIYVVAVLIGTGSSVTIISSLCLTAEIIGTNINRGASVYSIVTFADKLICGVAVVIIEHLKCPVKTECPEYYRYVLAYVSGGASLFGIITLCTLVLFKKKDT